MCCWFYDINIILIGCFCSFECVRMTDVKYLFFLAKSYSGLGGSIICTYTK